MQEKGDVFFIYVATPKGETHHSAYAEPGACRGLFKV